MLNDLSLSLRNASFSIVLVFFLSGKSPHETSATSQLAVSLSSEISRRPLKIRNGPLLKPEIPKKKKILRQCFEFENNLLFLSHVILSSTSKDGGRLGWSRPSNNFFPKFIHSFIFLRNLRRFQSYIHFFKKFITSPFQTTF